ncbi:tail assembly chaperone [Lysinibacillus halotolerans]
MVTLMIGGKEYVGKCNFMFDRTADEKYGNVDETSGKKVDGFSNIYTGLLNLDPNALLKFWDCALAYMHKEKPKLEDIEKALDERIEEDEDVLPAIQEAFNTIDESGFFKRQAKNFWKNIELMKEVGFKDKEEEKTFNASHRLMTEMKALLKGEEVTG